MFSAAEITAGQGRLVANKLTNSDIDSLIGNFRHLVGSLEETYGWDFATDLAALDDIDGREKAAKMAAGLILLIDSGFSTLKLTGKNNVAVSDEDERKLTILYMFNLLYKTPTELTNLQVLMNSTLFTSSDSIPTRRVW